MPQVRELTPVPQVLRAVQVLMVTPARLALPVQVPPMVAQALRVMLVPMGTRVRQATQVQVRLVVAQALRVMLVPMGTQVRQAQQVQAQLMAVLGLRVMLVQQVTMELVQQMAIPARLVILEMSQLSVPTSRCPEARVVTVVTLVQVVMA